VFVDLYEIGVIVAAEEAVVAFDDEAG